MTCYIRWSYQHFIFVFIPCS